VLDKDPEDSTAISGHTKFLYDTKNDKPTVYNGSLCKETKFDQFRRLDTTSTYDRVQEEAEKSITRRK